MMLLDESEPLNPDMYPIQLFPLNMIVVAMVIGAYLATFFVKHRETDAWEVNRWL